jgi:hypothetical protein
VFNITAEANNLSSKFFKSREFFPIDIKFGDKEKIRITKRPRKVVSEIIDIYANDFHIGMFVGIEKVGKTLTFGPAGINKSHSFRQILTYAFIRLLEYFGLNDLEAVLIDTPEDYEFKMFLTSLGFIPKRNRLILELTEEKIKSFLETIEKQDNDIKSQVAQIESIIRSNSSDMVDEMVNTMTDSIVEKIKNMDPLGKDFWDNRQIAQINTYLSSAILLTHGLKKDEFLEQSIKTIVSSFATYNREPYLEEIMWALEGKKNFSMDYIQKIVIKMKDLLKDEIAEMNKDELRKWVYENLPGWKITDKVQEDTRNSKIVQAQLKIADFGNNLAEHTISIIESLVNHYNGSSVFFGMDNRF